MRSYTLLFTMCAILNLGMSANNPAVKVETGMLEQILARINQCMKDGGSFAIETLPIDSSLFGNYFKGSLTLKRIRVTELHDVNEGKNIRTSFERSFDIKIPIKIETDYEVNGVIFGFVDIFGSGVSKDSLNINLKGNLAYDEPSSTQNVEITILDFEAPKLDPKFSFTGLQGDENISKLISEQLTQILSQISEEILQDIIAALLPKIQDVLNSFFTFAEPQFILDALNFLCNFE